VFRKILFSQFELRQYIDQTCITQTNARMHTHTHARTHTHTHTHTEISLF